MFGGEYRHNLDSKNRIFIPAKLRDDLGGCFVVAKDIRTECLKIGFPTAKGEDLETLGSDVLCNHEAASEVIAQLCRNKDSVFGIQIMSVLSAKHAFSLLCHRDFL